MLLNYLYNNANAHKILDFMLDISKIKVDIRKLTKNSERERVHMEHFNTKPIC